MKTFQELLAEFKMNEAKTDLIMAMNQLNAEIDQYEMERSEDINHGVEDDNFSMEEAA